MTPTLPETCSAASLRASEDTLGSAPTALAWVCLEQPGPWGPKALTSSGLDPAIGKAFEGAASLAGVRPQLIRSPGRHPEADGLRTLIVGYTAPGATWLVRGTVSTPARVLDLDFAAIAQGIQPDWHELKAVDEPVLLVCTNGRRDVCCATLGRDVATHAAASFPGRVWEANHLGGHRFAATTTLLPSGHMHGRVIDGTTILKAADQGLLANVGWRGRSTWPRTGQVAEGAIREREGIWELDAVIVSGAWRVSTADRAWQVSVEECLDGEAPPSCGKPAEPVRRFTTTIQ